jgi:RHS repeat-associated protein
VASQPDLSSAYTTTTIEPSGVHKTELSTAPLNYQDAQGTWRAIDNTLVATTGGGWHNTADSSSVQLPSDLSSPVTLSNGTSTIGFTLVGANSGSANEGTVAASTATYPDALTATTVAEQAVSSGVKETLSLASTAGPSTFTWHLSLSSGLHAATDGAGIDIDSGTATVATMAAPTVTDAAGAVGPASFVLNAAGTSLTLTVDPTWLGAPARVFPVTVDPSTSYLSEADGCTLLQATPTTASCSTTDLGVGYSGGKIQRSVVHFHAMSDGSIPVDAQVVNAYLSLPVDTLSGSVTLNAYPLTRAYSNSAATWNSYDGTHAWTTAGGDYASTPTVSGSVPSSGNLNMAIPTSVAQSWLNGTSPNDGLLLKASNESSGTNLADFEPSDTYGDFLDVYWTPSTGIAAGYPMVSHTLDDHLTLGVNAADGNLIVHSTDLSISGAAGQNEAVDGYYNSENLSPYTALGDGWSFGEGPGVYLEVNTDNVTIFLPSGQPAVFMDSGASWTTPAGVDAVLTEPTSGHYSLTYNKTQEVMKFTSQTCSSWAVPETSVNDRNGETITYAYSGTCDPSGIPFMSSITDTEGRVTTVSNNGNEYTGLSDPQTPTARTVTYNVSAYPKLLSSENTSGNYTYFTYGGSGAQITQIEDPNGNYTVIAYDGSGRVSTVTYVTNVGTMTGSTYTFAYFPGTTASPNSGYTTVTDPNSHVTTYYYNSSDLQTKVTDGNSNSRSGTYNADNQPSTLTDAITPAGVTNLMYDAKENQTEAQAPANGLDTPSTSYTNYQLTSGPSGYAYLPSSSVDAQNGCSVLGYDATGNVINTYSGEAAVSGVGEGTNPGCSSTTTYLGHSSAGYEGDAGVSCTNAKTGEICWSKDADGNQTNYAYDTAGDLASVTPPSPQGATTSTYDSLSRVASVTNGDGNSGTPGTITTVQSATTNMSASNVSTQTTTLTSNTTKGDTVVVIVGTNPVNPVISVSSITGGGVGTWHLGKATSSTGAGDEEIWYGYANTGGSNSITVTMSAGTTSIGTVAIELSGVASSSPLDVSGSTLGTSTTAGTASLTTTAAGDLVIDAANTFNGITASPGSPWTDYAGPTQSGCACNPVADRLAATTGAYSTSWTQSPSGAYVSVGVALKAAVETTAYTYDAMDRVTQALYGGNAACIPSSGNCITYTYDADGNLISRVDNTGTTTFTYDALNRLIDKGTPSGADACSGSSPAGITYTYDGASNLSTSCDALGTTHYSYDGGNRLTSQVEPSGTSGCAVSTHTTDTGCTAYSYDNDNRLLVTQFPGGATQTSAWTPSGLMASIVGANSSATTETSFVYSYATGTADKSLVQTRVENDPSVSSATTITYGYDTSNDLTSAVTTGGSSSTLDYYYDAAGNRCSTAASGTPLLCPSGTNYYAYNADNEMTAGPTGSYTYDAAGNQITSPQLSNLTYNSKNQNSSTTPSGGGAIASTYAGTGSTERTTDGSTTLVSGNFGIDQSITSGTTTYGIRNNTGTLIGEHVGSTSYYYLHDDEGSVAAVISASGAVQDREAFDPYGIVLSSSGTLANPFGYAGGYTDSGTGLVKFGNRFYDSPIGSFMQEDPSGQTNGYTYAADSPVNGTDPSGDSFLSCFAGVLGAFGAVLSFVASGISFFTTVIDGPAGVAAGIGFGGVGLAATSATIEAFQTC